MDWRFYLTYKPTNGATPVKKQVPEPEGWDAVAFTLRRSTTYWGMEFLFTETLTFVDKGYTEVVQAYEYDGIDALVEIEIAYFVRNQAFFQWQGTLNYSSGYKRDRANRKVQVGLKETDFAETFKNRLDVVVDLESAKDMDGNPVTLNAPQTIRLHGKTLYLAAEYKINQALDNSFSISQSSTSDTSAKAYHFVPPWEATVTDLDGYREPGYFVPAEDYPIFYSGDYPDGLTKRIVTLEFRYKQTIKSSSLRKGTIAGTNATSVRGTLRFSLFVKDLDNNIIKEYPIDYRGNIDTGGLFGSGYIYDSGDKKVTVELPENTKLVFDFFWEAESLSKSGNINGYQYVFAGTIDREVGYLKMHEDSLYPDSDCKGFLVFEAFSNLVTLMTGKPNAFKSTFFSRIDAVGSDLIDNEYGFLTITNGLNIRKMLDKNGNLFPISVSFKDLFDGLNNILNLGMRIEGDTVRIEPKNYFFQKTRKHEFLNANDIADVPAYDYIFNEVEVGYAKWETEGINGIDEFNSSRNYLLPIKNAKKKLPLLSKLIAAGYIIEDTRRQQYKEAPTTDYKNDNETFVIHVKREDSKYISVKGGYSSSSNVFSPETAYNIKLTPARNLGRWKNYLSGSVVKKQMPKAVFTSGKGNYQAVFDGIIENADQELSVIFLFQAKIITFTYPISFAEFLLLKQDAVFTIGVGCNGEVEYEGYLLEIEYKPNTNDSGIAEFQLLQS